MRLPLRDTNPTCRCLHLGGMGAGLRTRTECLPCTERVLHRQSLTSMERQAGTAPATTVWKTVVYLQTPQAHGADDRGRTGEPSTWQADALPAELHPRFEDDVGIGPTLSGVAIRRFPIQPIVQVSLPVALLRTIRLAHHMDPLRHFLRLRTGQALANLRGEQTSRRPCHSTIWLATSRRDPSALLSTVPLEGIAPSTPAV